METKRAFGYIRVSTDEQARSGLGLQDQRMRIHHYCAAMGVELVDTYEDAGVSGSTMDRPALNAMVSDVVSRKHGKIDMIVVLKLDRCGRTTSGVLDFMSSLREKGCEFVSVTEGFDSGSAVGRMVLTMLAGFATFERELTIERTRSALAVRKSRGERISRAPAYGFLTLETGGWMVVPDEIYVMNRIFAMHTQGMGALRIAKTLENEGFTGFEPTRDAIRNKLKCGYYLPLIKAEVREEFMRMTGLQPKQLPVGSVTTFDPEAEFTAPSRERLAQILASRR